MDPCGQAGGTLPKYAGGGADAVFTNTSIAKMGQLGSRVLPYAPSGTKWVAGSTVEVGWAIRYNHGGGYQYRLCPKPPPGGALTEDCFQQMVSFLLHHYCHHSHFPSNKRIGWFKQANHPSFHFFLGHPHPHCSPLPPLPSIAT
jgi:hypothetical protein